MIPKEYKKLEMRKLRKKWRREELLRRNQCPVCGMLLKEEYRDFHEGCSYLKEIATKILHLERN